MYGIQLLFDWQGSKYWVPDTDLEGTDLIELPDGTMLEVTDRCPLKVKRTYRQYRFSARARLMSC
ncbi:MAG: hypothetical protein K8F91_15790 [Candidatus Obscuribacterales bacterium]|nr:hypothetical protein [Candidatus Obscuribacterales bacterium]